MEFTPAEGRRRVAGTDWAALAAELDDVGCAATGPLLTPAECAGLAGLYDRPDLFRTTVDLARHRFGSGTYRYFTHDLPAPVAALRGALYPRLLPSPATGRRAWAARRPGLTPWRNGWPAATPRARTARRRSCSATAPATGTPCTGTSSGTGLPAPGGGRPGRVRRGLHRRRVPDGRAAPARPVPGHLDRAAPGSWPGLHDPGPPGALPPRLVGRRAAARGEHRTIRTAADAGAGVPRRELITAHHRYRPLGGPASAGVREALGWGARGATCSL